MSILLQMAYIKKSIVCFQSTGYNGITIFAQRLETLAILLLHPCLCSCHQSSTKTISALSWTPCSSSSSVKLTIFFFFAAFRVPTRASNRLAHLSSLNSTPNFTLILPSGPRYIQRTVEHQCQLYVLFNTQYHRGFCNLILTGLRISRAVAIRKLTFWE